MLEILPRESNQSLKQYVLSVLTYNIVRLNLKPGERVNESEISEQLKISRTPIREVLLDLSEKKIVSIQPRSGTFIAYIDMEIVSQFLYLRSVMERDLSRLACRCVTPDDIDQLRENIAIQKYYYQAHKPAKLLECDIKFHALIYSICKKDFVNDVISNLSIHFNRIRYLSITKKEFILKISEHEQYVDALEAGNAQLAMSISDRHMEHTFEDFEWIRETFPSYISRV